MAVSADSPDLDRRGREAMPATAIGRAERHGDALAALMPDIDHSRGINDRHGHAVGESLSRRSAHRPAATARP